MPLTPESMVQVMNQASFAGQLSVPGQLPSVPGMSLPGQLPGAAGAPQQDSLVGLSHPAMPAQPSAPGAITPSAATVVRPGGAVSQLPGFSPPPVPPQDEAYASCPRCHQSVSPTVGFCFICSEAIQPAQAVELPDFGPDFETLYPLGQGGMGQIFVVRDQAGREVVLKTMLDPAMVDRFRREAEVIARLNHPNIVTMFLFRPLPPCPYLVMEFCRGGSLRHAVARNGGPLDHEWFSQTMPPLLEALAHAQANNMVHRDISPENIFFHDGKPKLGDFGLAADRSRTQMTQSGMFMGKLHYAAPEQWEDAASVDIRADLFSLGMTMYYALTGRSPFPAIELDRVPPASREMIQALTYPDPGDRPETPLEASLLLNTRYSRIAARRPVSGVRAKGKPAPAQLDDCNTCGYDVSDTSPEAPFCPNCGVSQYSACPSCGNMGRGALAFCRHCGLNVGALREFSEALDAAVAELQAQRLSKARQMFAELNSAAPDGKTSDQLNLLIKQARAWSSLLDEVWKDTWNPRRARELAAPLLEEYPQFALLQQLTQEDLTAAEVSVGEAHAPRIEGFSFIGSEAFACNNDVEGRKEFYLNVYRCEAFAEAIGVGASARAIDIEFVLLPVGGTLPFLIGSPIDEAERMAFQERQAKASIRRPFLIARTVLSKRVYLGLQAGGERRATGSFASGAAGMAPATGISWIDAGKWCFRHGLRMPSEVEWEYACRGGTTTAFCFGSTVLPTQVNYDGHHPYGLAPSGASFGQAVSVGSLPSNAFGLHETHGNVWEWTADTFCNDFNETPLTGEPHRAEGDLRVLRGGCFKSHAKVCRSAHRRRVEQAFSDELTGLRPALSVDA